MEFCDPETFRIILAIDKEHYDIYTPVSYTHLDCMAKYLSWDMLFKKSYYATARDELEKNKDSMNELEGIGKNL